MHDTIPLWFLLFGLFLPRLTMFGALIAHQMPFIAMPGLLEFVGWLIVPRILIAYLIYERSGTCSWFWIYIVAAVAVWLFSSHEMSSNNE